MLQVLAALGTVYFEHVLPDIIRNCSHQRASVRDGYLTLFKVNTSLYDSLLISEVFAYRLSVIVTFLWEFIAVFAKVTGHPISELFATGSSCYIRWYMCYHLGIFLMLCILSWHSFFRGFLAPFF